METIRVNMNPNPLDVQTIHASQNDGKARQWGFELHNNGELIDTSDVKEQLFFKAYKGGTEQLLPENTSTPTTSPFKGDIKYPQGLLTDQKFLYRQSPTEEDGLAKITDIKGNTVVWNQLAEPLESGNYVANNGTVTYNNGVATYTASSAGSSRGLYQKTSYRPAVFGHNYLISALITSGTSSTLKFGFINTPNQTISPNTKQRITKIVTPESSGVAILLYFTMSGIDTFSVENLMMIDLTQMGLDITDPSDFTSLFPLSYYAYNQGSLLSFNGNGIKTVGFNQWDEEWEDGSITSSGVLQPVSSSIRSKNFCPCLPNTAYYLRVIEGTTGQAICWYDSAKKFIIRVIDQETRNAISPSNASYFKLSLFNYKIQDYLTYNNDVCLNISDTLKNGTYEPYTSSTLSLPISTYFPTGMKSAGSVYDELTETKAITRIGSVDLGSLTWGYRTTGSIFAPYFYTAFTGIKSNGDPHSRKTNILCSKYPTAYRGQASFIDKTICADGTITEITQIQIKDSSYTDTTAFKNSLQGQYLYYELATPTETPITTASLVTENAEIPLSNEDGVLIGKCTEQLSENPGFIDAKIKLTDSDGECYSNKIQLHIERSPQ